MVRKQEVPEDLIRKRSYQIWEEEGCPVGLAKEHWFRAKAELEAALFSDRHPYDKPGSYVSPRVAITCPPRKQVARGSTRREG